jgi:hypothetical protein
MFDSELVFFMGPYETSLQKVVATRMIAQRNTRPENIPSEETPAY